MLASREVPAGTLASNAFHNLQIDTAILANHISLG